MLATRRIRRRRSVEKIPTARRSISRPTVSVQNPLLELYKLYQNADETARVVTNETTRAMYEKEKKRYGKEIERIRSIIELKNYQRVIATLGTISELPAIDYNGEPFHLDSKRSFFNPIYVKQIRKILSNIVAPDPQSAEQSGPLNLSETEIVAYRARHWITHLRTIAAGAFGVTLKAGINAIDDYLAIKTPIVEGVDQRHEFLAGIEFNKMREESISPNFVYTYHFLSCTAPKIDDDGRVTGWCAPTDRTSRISDYLIIENVPNQGSLRDYFTDPARFNAALLWSTILQVIISLQLAEEKIGANHWDLHVDNILMRTVDPNSAVYYPYEGGVFIKTGGVIPTIFDFGLSSYRVPNTNDIIGPNVNITDRTSCYFFGRPFGMADAYRFIHNIYYSLVVDRLPASARPSNDEIAMCDLLERLLSPFFTNNNLGDEGEELSIEAVIIRIKGLRGVIASSTTTAAEKKEAERTLRDYGFLSLDSRMIRFTLKDYINFLFSDEAVKRDTARFSFIISTTAVPQGPILSCADPSNCGISLNQYIDGVSTYYDLDLFRANMYHFSVDQMEKIASKTLDDAITVQNALIADLRTFRRLTDEYERKQPPKLDEATMARYERYADLAIELWTNYNDIYYLMTIVAMIPDHLQGDYYSELQELIKAVGVVQGSELQDLLQSAVRIIRRARDDAATKKEKRDWRDNKQLADFYDNMTATRNILEVPINVPEGGEGEEGEQGDEGEAMEEGAVDEDEGQDEDEEEEEEPEIDYEE